MRSFTIQLDEPIVSVLTRVAAEQGLDETQLITEVIHEFAQVEEATRR